MIRAVVPIALVSPTAPVPTSEPARISTTPKGDCSRMQNLTMSTYRVSKIRNGSGPSGNNTVLSGNRGNQFAPHGAALASTLPCRPPKPPLLMIRM